jgi:hypothetical protein
MSNPVLLPPAIDEVPPPGVSIVEELDKRLMVQLRDGRKVIGILRSFDQFANLVLESTWLLSFSFSIMKRIFCGSRLLCS